MFKNLLYRSNTNAGLNLVGSLKKEDIIEAVERMKHFKTLVNEEKLC